MNSKFGYVPECNRYISGDKTMLMKNMLCDAVIRNTNKEKFNNDGSFTVSELRRYNLVRQRLKGK